MEDNFTAVSMSTLAAILSYEAEKHRSITGKTPGSELYFKAYNIFCDVYGSLWNPQGPFLRNIKNSITEIFPPVSQEVKGWLKELRQRGKFVFLLTSAMCDYTDLVMTNCFGAFWRYWFNLTISVARKPFFYNSDNSSKLKPVDTTRWFFLLFCWYFLNILNWSQLSILYLNYT